MPSILRIEVVVAMNGTILSFTYTNSFHSVLFRYRDTASILSVERKHYGSVICPKSSKPEVKELTSEPRPSDSRVLMTQRLAIS